MVRAGGASKSCRHLFQARAIVHPVRYSTLTAGCTQSARTWSISTLSPADPLSISRKDELCLSQPASSPYHVLPTACHLRLVLSVGRAPSYLRREGLGFEGLVLVLMLELPCCRSHKEHTDTKLTLL